MAMLKECQRCGETFYGERADCLMETCLDCRKRKEAEEKVAEELVNREEADPHF